MDIGTTDIQLATLDGVEIKERAGVTYELPERFSEVDIFCLMLFKFGHPNGMMTFLAPHPDGDPDAPWKWDFIFHLPDIGTIEIVRSWKSIEIQTRRIKLSKQSLIQFLEYNLDKYKTEIEETKRHLEDYRLLINPYKRHKLLAESFKEDLDKVHVQKPFYPKTMVATQQQIAKHNKSFTKYARDMNKEASYSISLCTHSAFMVEAFLNLILAIFMAPEIKEDKAIYSETIERPWRKKLKRLHLDCQAVSKADFGNAIIRDIAKVFELRNKVAHSYPAKEDLTVANMWFFKNFPILNHPEPFDQYQIAMNNQLPTKNEALFCYEVAQKMVEFLSALVPASLRDDFVRIAEGNPIGYNEATQRYSLPFSGVVCKGFSPAAKKC